MSTETRVTKIEHEFTRDGGVFKVAASVHEQWKPSERYDLETRKMVPIPADEQVWGDDNVWTDYSYAVLKRNSDGLDGNVVEIDKVNLYNQIDIDALRLLLDEIEASEVLPAVPVSVVPSE